MKNVLFASTALVAFAGAASAEVTLSGNAEMGIFNADSVDQNTNTAGGTFTRVDGETGFFTDIDVTFTMSGETDGGLTFGASIDLDESDGDPSGAFGGSTQGGETIFLSGAFGTLTAGDTDGALEWALTQVAFNSGSLNDDETVHGGYNGNSGLDGLYDGQILRYDYSFGDFGVALSAELNDATADDAGTNYNEALSDDVFGIGFKYQLDLGGSEIGLGLGYQTASVTETTSGNEVDLDTIGLSVTGSIAGFNVGLSYMTFENYVPNSVADGNIIENRIITPGQDTDQIGVGIGYTTGAISASLNYGKYDHDSGIESDGYGLTVGYDLGGGASVQFGYSDSTITDAAGVDTDFDRASFGVRMNF
ncbi:porin [Jannaschia helgolandensis]|uniref:Outer membrane protein OmpU n=1 Tax=Jannaschia helgolandensis TaxID=188906 RepID=A0A1H7G3L2_9RHOB|nr:porin [Jannaschia helgolandensis]SEK32926.1 outer membrane protein OmpU [Jannaschia helgolandensis]